MPDGASLEPAAPDSAPVTHRWPRAAFCNDFVALQQEWARPRLNHALFHALNAALASLDPGGEERAACAGAATWRLGRTWMLLG
jgi:hypothetical protein